MRRFRFVIADSPRRDTSEKRRIAVAEYVAGWPGAEIVGESRHGNEAAVLVTLRRAVPIEVVEQFVQECPHYVADTFAWLGG